MTPTTAPHVEHWIAVRREENTASSRQSVGSRLSRLSSSQTRSRLKEPSAECYRGGASISCPIGACPQPRRLLRLPQSRCGMLGLFDGPPRDVLDLLAGFASSGLDLLALLLGSLHERVARLLEVVLEPHVLLRTHISNPFVEATGARHAVRESDGFLPGELYAAALHQSVLPAVYRASRSGWVWRTRWSVDLPPGAVICRSCA